MLFGSLQLLASKSKSVALETELDSVRVQHADSLAQVRHQINLAVFCRKISLRSDEAELLSSYIVTVYVTVLQSALTLL